MNFCLHIYFKTRNKYINYTFIFAYREIFYLYIYILMYEINKKYINKYIIENYSFHNAFIYFLMFIA